MTGTYNNVANSPGQLALVAAMKSGVAYDFTLQLPPNPLASQNSTGNLYALSCIVTEAGGFDMDQTKVSVCAFSLKINSLTITPGA